MSIMNFLPKRGSLIFLLLALSISLQGCGGSRDEPFDPGDPEDPDNPDESGATISLIVEVDDSNPLRLSGDNQGRILEVIREEDEYIEILSEYIDVASTAETPDFEDGQVILYDAGIHRVCGRRLVLNGQSAEERVGNNNVALVKLTYREQAAVADTACSDTTATTRPFKFFYISTRRDIIFEEDLN